MDNLNATLPSFKVWPKRIGRINAEERGDNKNQGKNSNRDEERSAEEIFQFFWHLVSFFIFLEQTDEKEDQGDVSRGPENDIFTDDKRKEGINTDDDNGKKRNDDKKAS